MNKAAVAPQALIFDLDGTLVPTMDDYADRAAQLMEAHFGTPRAHARRDYLATSGLPFEQQLRQLYPARTETDIVARQFEAWKDSYLRTVELPAETAGLLDGWRREGFRIAISSNNLEAYVARMARDWPVDIALGYRPALAGAPPFAKGEAHFRVLEHHFGMNRASFLFIGDSPNDARIARSAAVPFRALLTTHFSVADFERAAPNTQVIRQISEIVPASISLSAR